MRKLQYYLSIVCIAWSTVVFGQKKISALNELQNPLATDVLPIVSDGETKKISVENLTNLVELDSGEVIGNYLYLTGEYDTLIIPVSDLRNFYYIDSNTITNSDTTLFFTYQWDNTKFNIDSTGVYVMGLRDSLQFVWGVVDFGDGDKTTALTMFQGTSNALGMTGFAVNGVLDYASFIANELRFVSNQYSWNHINTSGNYKVNYNDQEFLFKFPYFLLEGLNTYADHAAADSDGSLPTFAVYQLTGDRTLYLKP